MLLALYVVLGLTYLVVRHYVWPNLDDFRPRIVAHLTSIVGRPVEVESVRAGFNGLSPSLDVRGVRIRGDDGEDLLRIPAARATLSLSTFVAGEPRLAELQLEHPYVVVERLANGRIRAAGVELAESAAEPGQGLDLVLAQRRIVIESGDLLWRDAMRADQQRLTGVDAEIGSLGRRHRAAVRVGRIGALAGDTSAVIEFYRPPGAQASAWKTWQGEVFLGANQVDVTAWVGAGLPRMALSKARADAKLWGRFESGRLDDVLLKVAGAELAWTMNDETLRLPRFAAEIRARKVAGGGYDVRLPVLDLTAEAGFSPKFAGESRLWIDDAWQVRSGRFVLAKFQAGAALAAARRLPLSPQSGNLLKRLATAGEVQRLELAFTRGEQLQFDAEAEFERLSVLVAPLPDAPPGLPGMPSFENVSGKASLTHEGGQLSLRARASRVIFPGLFDDPVVDLDSLSAQASWTMDFTGVHPLVTVKVDQMAFSNADAAGQLTGTYRSGGKGPGIVDIDGQLQRAEVSRTARYLPTRLSRPVREWVTRSVTAGQSNDVRFRLRGDLYDFPYVDPELGEFSIAAKVTDGVLAYSPDWPKIEKFQGSVLFERNAMDITARSGNIFGLALGETRARISELSHALLVIEGSAQGAAQEMIRFVNESALSTRIDDFTRDTQAQGNAQLLLKLELPLADLAATKVNGKVLFSDNTITLDRTVPTFSHVNGRLEFTEKGLALREITSTFLDGPLQVEGETQQAGRFSLRARGSITAQTMQAVSDNPLTSRLQGATDYRANIEVQRRAATVTIESDLVGLASTLPEPFAKPAQARWPLKVVTQPRAPATPDALADRDLINVTLKDNFRLLFERVRESESGKLRIQRGAFAVNAEPGLPDAGFAVFLNSPAVDIDAWSAILANAPVRAVEGKLAAEFAEGFSLLPNLVSVVADKVSVGGKDLHDVVFGATRLAGFWRANIVARELNGFFNWREPAAGQRVGTLTARFARLEIPRSRSNEIESLFESTQRELPALDIAAEEFVLGDHKLGRLKVKAAAAGSAGNPVWNLSELSLELADATLNASGAWSIKAGQGARSTALDFKLDIKDSGRLLTAFGLKDVLKGGEGTMAGSIRWDGSPLALDYPSLGGKVNIELGKGQFLKSDPGIAKLIGVLNLQSLPRRLTLDFRDVFAEGFAFDRITGDAAIRAGVAHTENFTMRGVQAQVRIRGDADLARETQALEVQVQPELNAGLASLAYAAMVNPAIGLSSFVAQMVLRKPLEKLFTYEYAVNGAWADPQVVEKRRVPEPLSPPLQ